jgi:hypothetical protein
VTKPEVGLFARLAEKGLGATVEALYPENDFGAPDFRTTEMVPRTLEYWALLPRHQRRLLMALYVLIELGAVFLVSGFRRFSELPAWRREQAVRDFRRSKLLPFRILGDALKASTTIIYMSHPAVLAHIGMVVVCERPNDRLTVEVDRDALARMDSSP